MQLLRRHLLPMLASTALIALAWVVITLPMAAVFMLDNQFNTTQYLSFVLYATAIGLAVSFLALMPLSLLLDLIAKRNQTLAIILPIVLLICAFVNVIGMYVYTKQLINTVLTWPGLLLAFAVVFIFYRLMLWLNKVVFTANIAKQFG